jgi:hypothetical protein
MTNAPIRRKADSAQQAPSSMLKTGLLTPTEAGELLSVSVTTLANWRFKGTGPVFIRLSGLIRYSFTDLEAFVSSNRNSITGRAAYALAS